MDLIRHPDCNPACNACHYKGQSYDQQLSKKQAWAASNLGKWGQVLQLIRPAPEAERLAYRSKTWLRSSFEREGLSFGMHRAVKVEGKWKREFVSWDTCPLHLTAIQKMIGRLREVLASQAGDFAAQSLFGVWMGSPHVVLVGREGGDSLRAIRWDRVLEPPFSRVWFHRANQVGRTIFQNADFEWLGGECVDRQGAEAHPILAFRQVAQTLLTEARALAVSHLLAAQPKLVVDLYSGTGDLSLLFPASVGWLGIEIAQSATEYANQASVPGRDFHQAFTGSIEQRLRDPRVLEKIEVPYALYLNPPRSGLSAEAVERVVALVRSKRPSSVVILSCSASSLARDLRPFEESGFSVRLLQPYDFFPQTEHFETLAVLA